MSEEIEAVREEQKTVIVNQPNEAAGCGLMLFGCGFLILCVCFGIGGCTYLSKHPAPNVEK